MFRKWRFRKRERVGHELGKPQRKMSRSTIFSIHSSVRVHVRVRVVRSRSRRASSGGRPFLREITITSTKTCCVCGGDCRGGSAVWCIRAREGMGGIQAIVCHVPCIPKLFSPSPLICMVCERQVLITEGVFLGTNIVHKGCKK